MVLMPSVQTMKFPLFTHHKGALRGTKALEGVISSTKASVKRLRTGRPSPVGGVCQRA